MGLLAPHDAVGVFAGPRVDADPVALVHEDRALELVAAGDAAVLHDLARGGVALGAGVAPLDLALDERRERDLDRVAVEEEDLALEVVLEEVLLVAEDVGRDVDLLAVRVEVRTAAQNPTAPAASAVSQNTTHTHKNTVSKNKAVKT